MTDKVRFEVSKPIPAIHGDDVLFSMFVSDEMSKLRRLLAAIGKWRRLVDTEFEEFQKLCDQKHTSIWDEYGYDPAQDEAFMLLATERVMFANLAVTIASAAENFIIGVCKARKLSCGKNGKTDLSIALGSLGKAVGQAIPELPGYGGNQRARLLGNCFKHSEGKTNGRFVEKYGGAIAEEIEYEKEVWPSMIDATEALLNEITQRLAPGASDTPLPKS